LSQSPTSHVTWRHWTMALLVLAGFVMVMGRLYEVQVLNHEQYLEEAAVTRQGAAVVPAPRGAILDATGYPLATSVDTWDIYIDRFLWRDTERASRAAIELGAFLGLDPDALMRMGTEQPQGDALVVRNFEYQRGVQLDEMALWGVRTLPSSSRVYPEGDLAVSLLGYVGLDNQGLWGVEADFDHILRGRDGWITSERDALGRPIAFTQRTERPAAGGGEVQLTIDRFMQAIVEETLAEAIQRYGGISGSIIVMDPHTGAVLAMASSPSPKLSQTGLDTPDLSNAVRNRAITDLYEPGSVLKTLTAAAALDAGLVTPDSGYEDSGEIDVGDDYVIRNWDFSAHGWTTVRELLQKSLNTGSVWLSDVLGARAFYHYMEQFGLTESTHIGLSGEAEGAMRTPADPDWYPVDLATNSYGQGLAVTPIQMLTAVNSFANGGVLMRPYVISRVVTGSSVREYEPVTVRQVVSPETAETMRQLMTDVVEGVATHGARVPGYDVAGKTGTTLVSIPTGYALDSTIASFAGFLPAHDPQISILVKIDQPSGGLNLGGQVAAPVFAELAAELMAYLNVPPDYPSQLAAQP
jgi:cell division protein FtsI/penicillin-binding protein 2